MSQIDTSGIDATFPVAGRDNDSRGFNDNFSEIKSALSIAATEISDIQAKAVFKSKLTENSSLDNDMNGNLIKNGQFSQLSPVFADRGQTITTSTDNLVDLDLGPVHKFVLNDSSNGYNFIFGNWSQNDNQVSQVRLILVGESSTLRTATFTRTDGGHNYFEVGFPSPLQVSSTKMVVIDAWTVDKGDHVYFNVVGTY
jgi:hypothetical protein